MPPQPLIQGIDYYIEQGLYVFTESFLRRRGYCCTSGCRHCPYGYRDSPPCPARLDRRDDLKPDQ